MKVELNEVLIWLQGAAELTGKGPIICALHILEQFRLNNQAVGLTVASSDLMASGLSRQTAIWA